MSSFLARTQKVNTMVKQTVNAFVDLSARPSAFLPIAMSLAALLVLAGVALTTGLSREADEGAAAHAWQFLMLGQVPILAFFLIRWLPRLPRPAILVFALQLVAALAAMAPVRVLGL
jgi:hypothetical protein